MASEPCINVFRIDGIHRIALALAPSLWQGSAQARHVTTKSRLSADQIIPMRTKNHISYTWPECGPLRASVGACGRTAKRAF